MMDQQQHYLSAGGGGQSPRHLETLSGDIGTRGMGQTTAFQPLTSFHPQTTTYYSPAPTTFHVSSSFGQDRKDYITSIQGLTPVRLPALSTSLTANGSGTQQMITSSLSGLKEHPAAVQADQMNAYMEFFVDPDQGTSSRTMLQADEDPPVEHMQQHMDNDMQKDVHLMDMPSNEPSSLAEMTEEERRQRCSELARLRYHRLSEDEKRQVNGRRAELMKKKRQAERERRELDDILRETNDVDDVEMADRVRSQQSKARRAEAARSRYQRMSEAERKAYNHRRRLKALGIDPDSPQSAQDPTVVKDSIRMANAKKAEAARLRYHRMSAEERREYNQRRTESFRKRRMEEEILLSTPAGRISAEALAKAQQIMIRNARKAEAARARYQKMTPEERKEYNIRRAQSKKARNMAMGEQRTPSMMSSDCSLETDDMNDISLNGEFPSEPPIHLLEQQPSSHSSHVDQTAADSVARDVASIVASDDIFHQMEREVEKRTKQAHRSLARQQLVDSQQQQQHLAGRQLNNRYTPSSVHDVVHHSQLQMVSGGSTTQGVGGAGDTVAVPGPDGTMMQQDKLIYTQSSQMLIDEKALHDMLMTGRDANGLPVELRTMDGQRIQEEHQLRALTQGQPILIQPTDPAISHVDTKDHLQIYSTPGGNEQQLQSHSHSHMSPSTSSHDTLYPRPIEQQQQQDLNELAYRAHPISSSSESPQMAMTPGDRHALSKARRAERARIRYHSMRPEIRQQQNARRADLLRKSRQRDEQLVQLAESVDPQALPDETRVAIEDAQQRRARRAEQARAKYHRMNSEERRQYNAMRDAQRRQRKRQQESRGRGDNGQQIANCGGVHEHDMSEGGPSNTSSLSPPRRDVEPVEEQIIYGTYDMYDEPMPGWADQ